MSSLQEFDPSVYGPVPFPSPEQPVEAGGHGYEDPALQRRYWEGYAEGFVAFKRMVASDLWRTVVQRSHNGEEPAAPTDDFIMGHLWLEQERVVSRRHQAADAAEMHKMRGQMAVLETMAGYDQLTGLPNRHRLDALLQELRDKDHPERSHAIMLDIDHFKGINDMFGHHIGDLVLQEVAKRIQGNVREGDVVMRYGGEELLIILRNIPTEGAMRIAERLRAALDDEPVRFEPGVAVTVTGSFGVAYLDLDNSRESLSRADAAMYTAKEQGRNTVRAAVGLIKTDGGA